MNNDKITLTIQDILDKEFKIDATGYRMQEVDQFLDIIIRDYNEYNNTIKKLIEENNKLNDDNNSLKQEIRSLQSIIEAAKGGEKEVTNIDLLRRISKLEKIVLGHEE